MDDIEIRFRNDQVYLLKHHDFSATFFENQISGINYSGYYANFKEIKDSDGAEKCHLPAVNMVFYKAIFNTGGVLQPEEFVNCYYAHYHDLFTITGDMIEYCGKQLSKAAVSARVLRTYPSLVRDFDFFLMLHDSGKFEQVIYSCQQDIQGKDIIIKQRGKEYVVSLFVDTKRSNFFKSIKNAFRHSYESNEIQLPLKLSSARIVGDFMLYSEKDIYLIEERIKKNR